MIALIQNFFNAVGSVFGWVKSRSDAANTPEMVAAAKAKDEVKKDDLAKEAVSDALKTKDLEEIRKLTSE